MSRIKVNESERTACDDASFRTYQLGKYPKEASRPNPDSDYGLLRIPDLAGQQADLRTPLGLFAFSPTWLFPLWAKPRLIHTLVLQLDCKVQREKPSEPVYQLFIISENGTFFSEGIVL